MLEIDGSHGEGGGQILRTSVTLSALTKTPCTITNIRGNRPNPGLKPQHLKGLQAAADICNADTSGFSIGSERIEFTPHQIKSGKYTIEIGTAGSIALILQVLVPICLHAPDVTELVITGGTDVKWSPTMSYFKNVFVTLLTKMGAKIDITVEKYGFYPKGGGKVKAVVHPWKNKSALQVDKRGPLQEITVESIASTFLKNAQVAERQADAFMRKFPEARSTIQYAKTLNPGSTCCGIAYCTHSVLGADSLGEKGKPAEKVGTDPAVTLKKELASHAALDTHMADQVIPYLALLGGTVSVAGITEHTKTNIWVCHQFLDTDISVKQNTITAVL
ncbi:MAG: RNA 3'-terminal phosphate cyclase [Candidatus Methanofastidiosia archaeon]|jgi:RNA 3'-phosphate cyclase